MGAGFAAGLDPGTGRFVTGHRFDSTLGPSHRLGVSPPACGYNARHSVRSVCQARFLRDVKKPLVWLEMLRSLSAPSPSPEGETHGTAYASV